MLSGEGESVPTLQLPVNYGHPHPPPPPPGTQGVTKQQEVSEEMICSLPGQLREEQVPRHSQPTGQDQPPHRAPQIIQRTIFSQKVAPVK